MIDRLCLRCARLRANANGECVTCHLVTATVKVSSEEEVAAWKEALEQHRPYLPVEPKADIPARVHEQG